KRVVGRFDVLCGEQLAYEPLPRDDTVCAHQQHCEQRSLLGAPDREWDTVHPNRERPEDSELEATRRHCVEVSSLRRASTTAADGLGTTLGHGSGTLGACNREQSGLSASWPRFSSLCRYRVCRSAPR